MFSLNQQGINSYAKIGVETGVLAASPVKLVVMLYEGAITACNSAVVHMQRKDFEHKGAALTKAILIIETGLRVSLDKKSGGAIAESLDALYVYMSDRLTVANVRNDSANVKEVIKLLIELKNAWEEIDKSKATAQVVNQSEQKQPVAGVNLARAYMA